MIERRNVVKNADEQNGNVQAALSELQKYVSAHMNTHLGKGIFLEYSYQRAYEAALAQAASKTNPNSTIYTEAEQACQQEYMHHGVFSRYIQCVQEKLKAMAPGTDPLTQVKQLPPELFTYNFISPVWSADLAGLSLLATLLIFVVLLLRVVGTVVLHLLLKSRKT